MWFDSTFDLVRILAVGGSAYLALVILTRIFGKRTLAKLNAFDLVVTVALGSVLASVLLSSDVAFLEGLLAMLLLMSVQWLVAQSLVRLPWTRSIIVSEPTALVWDGQLLTARMREQRIAEAEVQQAIRRTGTGGIEDVAAVVLESDGQLSVISRSQLGSGSTLENMTGIPTHNSGHDVA
ncbi:DUF421 domain-containing protein [Gephyromycinifex aptenodytis]|uniref:DUF421 domain-containing protein n=1 Tax=Gephyromycinifex aptenodytis TaxID=2716227 RepID=UPI00144889CC|nr:YetF domain-containing protein [Gephyromycinifex aptenodytis]